MYVYLQIRRLQDFCLCICLEDYDPVSKEVFQVVFFLYHPKRTGYASCGHPLYAPSVYRAIGFDGPVGQGTEK